MMNSSKCILIRTVYIQFPHKMYLVVQVERALLALPIFSILCWKYIVKLDGASAELWLQNPINKDINCILSEDHQDKSTCLTLPSHPTVLEIVNPFFLQASQLPCLHMTKLLPPPLLTNLHNIIEQLSSRRCALWIFISSNKVYVILFYSTNVKAFLKWRGHEVK